ncbi:MAG: SHOCT domain-containing protein [Gammaproteobacteria bacterium]|nr:SHOCT domain-containing protein [Gammaproteobacteria bacterium]NIT54464.1 SHOCT domain-containing protein [candidate division Zixibacteria bacterium]NIX59885.1 SHOCT domain-containing protein [candidate division Zixibacteria bacterium]
MMGFGGILTILLIAVIVWAVIQFTGKNSSNNPFTANRREPQGDKENALDILKQRYARGEISRDEYEKMKNEIS